MSDAKVGRWFSRLIGGPTVLVGQEILSPGHHVIGVGTEEVVDSRDSVAGQIDAIHRQGGVAIAAHPVRSLWPAFDPKALARLDGAEIAHPLIYCEPDGQRDLEEFGAKAHLTAIGSSDFHDTGRMGMCRTYVFAKDATPAAILDALRAHRTVVYGVGGKPYGDETLTGLPAEHPELREAATTDAPPRPLDWISRACGVLGLLSLTLARKRK